MFAGEYQPATPPGPTGNRHNNHNNGRQAYHGMKHPPPPPPPPPPPFAPAGNIQHPHQPPLLPFPPYHYPFPSVSQQGTMSSGFAPSLGSVVPTSPNHHLLPLMSGMATLHPESISPPLQMSSAVNTPPYPSLYHPTQQQDQQPLLQYPPPHPHGRFTAQPQQQPIPPLTLARGPPPSPTTSSFYPQGFSLHVYNSDLTHHFVIPSECVERTAGSEKYCKIYAAHGPQMKYKFQLCWENVQGMCSYNARCTFIHCSDLSKAVMTDVHYNTDECTSARHDPGIEVSVELPAPTVGSATHVVDSGCILKTQGSRRVIKKLMETSTDSIDSGPTTPILTNTTTTLATTNASSSVVRSQHCAHFYLHRVCTRGSYCNFMHVLARLDPKPKTSALEGGGENTGNLVDETHK